MCDYCAFYKEQPTSHSIERYLCGIAREMTLLRTNRPFDTVYIGGGTPGLLTPEHLESLCEAMGVGRSGTKLSEFSVEFSPITVKNAKVEILKNYGCNRLTIGAQSFSSKTMQALGRRQNRRQIFDAFDAILSCGIENIGIDLIFGVPGQALGEWMEDLHQAVDLKPKHISTYNLTFEDGTPLKRNLLANAIDKKFEEEEADFYLQTWKFLEESGYRQYEISNFCLPGFESIHNANTWKMQDWIGIGPSACSQWNGKRFANVPSLARWLGTLDRGKLAHENAEAVCERTLAEDSIIFGLRMNDGIALAALKKEFAGVDFTRWEELFRRLEEEKLMLAANGHVKLTTRGRLLADAIAVEVLAANR
jgi:oxygen-independent coproporphyrinogen-3 oxidase